MSADVVWCRCGKAVPAGSIYCDKHDPVLALARAAQDPEIQDALRWFMEGTTDRKRAAAYRRYIKALAAMEPVR